MGGTSRSEGRVGETSGSEGPVGGTSGSEGRVGGTSGSEGCEPQGTERSLGAGSGAVQLSCEHLSPPLRWGHHVHRPQIRDRKETYVLRRV